MSFWFLAGASTGLVVLMMAGVWVASRHLDNAGWVDVAWAYSFTIVVAVAVLCGEAPPVRGLLLGAMVAVWSLRLGTHLAVRVARHHPKEDSRYADLRKIYPKAPWVMFFWFFLAQGLLVGILSLPVFLAASNPSPTLSPWEIAGAALWLAALSGESLADAQLTAFRKIPANAGRVCDHGLWKFSRHPNYFFEWLVWVAFAVFAAGSPHGWAAFAPPLIMLFLLTRVTGIPPAEAASLRSRGDAYRDYQRRTSPFFPLPPRA